ncbi:DUF5819 family protein [Streptomyces sp. NBC_01455]|uniref:DUF5819 family protein n=1 Tax=Streptomyces sp. NBC_01455 TaxID=2903874 RepID=UPI002E370F26|nr:DUF5819 family protein [Streptomyces sp. NBC_01455]
MKELPHSDPGPTPQECTDITPTPARLSKGARALKTGLSTAVILCVATTLVHVVLVFLQVAPTNTVSKRYSPLINSWVYPFFEQNWRLFAPDPDSVNRQILARTARNGAGTSVHVSSWFDLTAVDNSAVEHDAFPSHTAQNLLRRSWTSYVETYGGDDRAHTERALMMQKTCDRAAGPSTPTAYNRCTHAGVCCGAAPPQHTPRRSRRCARYAKVCATGPSEPAHGGRCAHPGGMQSRFRGSRDAENSASAVRQNL